MAFLNHCSYGRREHKKSQNGFYNFLPEGKHVTLHSFHCLMQIMGPCLLQMGYAILPSVWKEETSMRTTDAKEVEESLERIVEVICHEFIATFGIS